MADYISRAELMGKLTASGAQAKLKAMSGSDAYNEFLMLVNDAPAADVEPVRHVRKYVCCIDEYYGEWLQCPICGYSENTNSAKCCGGCGAKMDLEGKGNDN